jgi:AraC family transcriptional regulator, transcriptional activator of pobA
MSGILLTGGCTIQRNNCTFYIIRIFNFIFKLHYRSFYSDMKKDRTHIPFQHLAQEETAGFIIRPLQKDFTPEDSLEKPHRHSFQEIIWIKTGQGKNTIDEYEIDVTPNTFYIISQGQVHNFPEGHNMEGLVICFANDFLPGIDFSRQPAFYSSLLSATTPVNEISLREEETAEYETLLKQLLMEQNKPFALYGKKSALQYLLMLLLIKLERKGRELTLTNPNENSDKKLYFRFLHLLEEQYNNQHDIIYYAGQLATIPRRLTDVVRQFSGKSAKQLIVERILVEAKRLLNYTDSNIKDITYHLGYDDPGYFCRIFKNQTGLTPNEYKSKKKHAGDTL